MAQKKPHTSFADDLNKLKNKTQLSAFSNDTISISSQDYSKQKESDEIRNQKYLALNFKYLTQNDKFNFSYFKKDKSKLKEFINNLETVVIRVTTKQVKDLYNFPFKDKIRFNKLFAGVYKNNELILEGTEELISVEASSKHDPFRMILYHRPNSVQDENILYVLLFQFNFNEPAYKH